MSYLEQLEKELWDKCDDIPFENSLYQNECFVLNQSHTAGRAVRNIGLRLSAKLTALRELEFSLTKIKIDVEEIDAKLGSKTGFDKKRAELERAQKLAGLRYTKKLAKDALVETEYLRAVLAKLPKLSRAEFESQEKEYFLQSLTAQARGVSDAAKSLFAMGVKELPRLADTPLVSERLGFSASDFLANFDAAKQLEGET